LSSQEPAVSFIGKNIESSRIGCILSKQRIIESFRISFILERRPLQQYLSQVILSSPGPSLEGHAPRESM
jgi:hypothetical protein